MNLSYKMSLSMNYLSFEPVKKNFGFTTGGFDVWSRRRC